MILCLETSAEYCSVCLSKGEEIVASQLASERFTHASSITLFIETCLKEAGLVFSDIDAIAVSMGPGSYTGLRVGLSAAKGLAYALDKPLIGISTLKALAFGAAKKNDFQAAIYIPMIDARRMEVYTESFSEEQISLSPANALVLTETSFLEYKEERVVFCGNSVDKARSVLQLDNAIYLDSVSVAEYMVSLAFKAWEQKNFLDLAYCEPFYLKRPNITISKKNVLDKIINDKNL